MVIEQLPTWIQAYQPKFPNTIAHVARAWKLPPIQSISPNSTIEVYFADHHELPDYGLVKGKPFFNIQPLPTTDERIVLVNIDGLTCFVQITDTVLLDKMQGQNFPDCITLPYDLYNFLLKN